MNLWSGIPWRPTKIGDRGALLLLAALTGLCCLLILRPTIALDGISYFSYLRSAAQDGDLVLLDEFTALGVARADFNLTPEGQVRNVFPIGSAVLWWPFYLIGNQVALGLERLRAVDRVDGYSLVHVFYVYIATACFGLAALALSRRFAAPWAGSGPALHATIAVWLGSPFLYYQFIQGDYSHVPAALCVALFIVLWYRTQNRRSAPAHLLLGFVGGVATMVRWQHGLILLLPVTDLVVGLAARRRDPGTAARPPGPPPPLPGLLDLGAFAAGFLLGAAPQLAYWRITLGEWIAIPQGPGFLKWNRPEIGRTFFSFHGLFSWHPLLLVAVLGLLGLARRAPRLAIPLLILFAAETYVNSIVWDWEAGVSFGGRRFVGLTILFVLGLAVAYRRLGFFPSALVTAVASLCNLLLLYEFHFGHISRRWQVTLQEILGQHARHVQHLDQVVSALSRDHAAQLWPEIVWPVVAPALGLVAATALLLAAPKPIALWTGGALVVLLGVAEGTFVRAAVASRPAPTAALRIGDSALIDFRWYENGHYHLDPFRPGYPGRRHFLGLGGRELRLGSIPFRILDPLAKPLANGCAITTCHLLDATFEVPLAAEPTRALWLAVDGGVLDGQGQQSAGWVEIVYAGGAVSGRELVAEVDVWDFWRVPPADRLLWQGALPSDLTWVRIAADSARIPALLRLRSLSQPAKRGPGFTVFAVTQEPIARDPIPILIAEAANTDFMQDPFRPEYLANHFPHLAPGTYLWGDLPYLILDVDPESGRGTVITTAWQDRMRLKVPLLKQRTERVDLVVDGAGIRDLPHLYLGDLLVHYTDGPPEVVHVQSAENVWDYFEDPLPTALVWRGSALETLSVLKIDTDPSRVVSFLEIRSAAARGNQGIVAGYAVFAITQKLVPQIAGAPDAQRASM
jgi:hypothetical protein